MEFKILMDLYKIFGVVTLEFVDMFKQIEDHTIDIMFFCWNDFKHVSDRNLSFDEVER